MSRRLSIVHSQEITRLHDHLAGAERQVRARRVSHLPAAVRRVRARVVEALATYRRARRYPHNHLRETRTPVFIDEHGTRCAMAHLLEVVGAHALVARVAATNNLASVHELARDPELLRWLSAMGLTVDEAARIQPSYSARRSWCWCDPEDQPATSVVTVTNLGPAEGGTALTCRVDKVHGGTGVAVGDTIDMRVGYAAFTKGSSRVVALLRPVDGVYGVALPKDSYNYIDCIAIAKTYPVSLDDARNAVLSTTCNATLIAKYPALAEFERWPEDDDTGTTPVDTGMTKSDSGRGDTGVVVDSGAEIAADPPADTASSGSCSVGSAGFGFAPVALALSAALWLRRRHVGR